MYYSYSLLNTPENNIVVKNEALQILISVFFTHIYWNKPGKILYKNG